MIVTAFLLIAAWASCQESATVRRLLISVGEEGVSVGESGLLVLSKSLGLALTEASPSVRVIEYGGGFPKDTEKRTLAAEERQADCWLWVGVAGQKSSPTLNVKSYDLLRQATLFDQSIALNADLGSLGAMDGKWEALVTLMLNSLEVSWKPTASGTAIDEAQAGSKNPGAALLTIKALPGTLVTGLPTGRAEVGIDGALTVSLAAPASYSFRASKGGYNPVIRHVYLDDNRELVVEQKADTRWSVDAAFSNAFFPGVAGRFYVIPGWLYVEAGVTAYVFGLQLDTNSMFYSFPLTNIGVQIGGYFTAEDALFRLYGGAGAFLRLFWNPIQIDPLSPVIVQACLGTDIAMAESFRFFLELTPMLYLSTYPDLLSASFTQEFLLVDLSFGIVSLGNIRFGVRWLL